MVCAWRGHYLLLWIPGHLDFREYNNPQPRVSFSLGNGTLHKALSFQPPGSPGFGTKGGEVVTAVKKLVITEKEKSCFWRHLSVEFGHGAGGSAFYSKSNYISIWRKIKTYFFSLFPVLTAVFMGILPRVSGGWHLGFVTLSPPEKL